MFHFVVISFGWDKVCSSYAAAGMQVLRSDTTLRSIVASSGSMPIQYFTFPCSLHTNYMFIMQELAQPACAELQQTLLSSVFLVHSLRRPVLDKVYISPSNCHVPINPFNMQFKSVFVLLAVATSNVLAAANSDQTVSDINAIAEKTRITKKAIDNYNGGITGALMISRAIYNAHTTAETARRNLHGADPFADDDGGKMLEAYDEMYPLLIDTLKSAQKKVR